MTASGNHSSNGYWIHDDFGPRHYVAPSHGTASGGATVDSLPLAIERLTLIEGAERVHLTLEDEVFHLKGSVANAVTLSALLKALGAIGPFDARSMKIVATGD